MAKKGLGKGLEALLGNSATATVTESAEDKTQKLQTLPVDLLQRGQYQPRSDMKEESLIELADSIKAQGIIQPIVVRKISERQYEIIAGERRWRAAQQAGLEDVPVVIKEISDETAMAMALIENIQREDLNAMEESFAIQRLIKEFTMTHDQVAESLGKSRTTVTNLLRLSNLNSDVQELIRQRKLELGHAKVLLALDALQQSKAAHAIVGKGLSVRQTEQLVKNLNAPKQIKIKTQQKDPNIARLETDLSEKLGARVQINHSGKSKGHLTIYYTSLEELDGVIEHIH